MRHQVMQIFISLHTDNDDFFLAHDSYEIVFKPVHEWNPADLFKFLDENFEEKKFMNEASESVDMGISTTSATQTITMSLTIPRGEWR